MCTDIDECLAENDGCEHECQNSAGSFTCSCRPGYGLNTDRRSCTCEWSVLVFCTGSDYDLLSVSIIIWCGNLCVCVCVFVVRAGRNSSAHWISEGGLAVESAHGLQTVGALWRLWGGRRRAACREHAGWEIRLVTGLLQIPYENTWCYTHKLCALTREFNQLWFG